MKIFLTLFLIILLSSCQQKKENSSIPSATEIQKSIQADKTEKGFVVLKNTYQQKDFLNIYNEDHSIWKSFQMTDTFRDAEIIPYSMKPENTLLVFRFLGKEDGFYKVLANEDKNTIKYIRESDANFDYQTVAQHLTTVFAVDFNEKENPLKKQPDDNAPSVPMDQDSFYYPVKTKGNWLMVQDDNQQSFWIKWCNEKGHLILELYYDA